MGSASRRAAASVDSTAEASFATDEQGRIVACNGAAEGLLGVASGEVLGRRCYRVVAGRDLFGNRFCRPDCSLRESARSGRPLCAFELELERPSAGPVRVGVTCIAMREDDSSGHALVHLLRALPGPGPDPLEGMRVRARRCREAPDPEPPAREEAATGGPRPSPREMQVLRLLAGGRSPREIGAELGISLQTVRTHVRNLLRKLGVHGVTQAVTHALRCGLV